MNRKTYVGIGRDHSGSMSSLVKGAMKDYNDLIKQLRSASDEEGIDTIVNTVTFGELFTGIKKEAVNSSLNAIKLLTSYTANGSTPLFDAVGELITMMENVPDSKEPNVNFLVQIVTDGEENTSSKWTADSLLSKIKKLQATDKWTFTFRVPKGYAKALSNKLGVPLGNIQEWEQTDKGIKESSTQTVGAIKRFYAQTSKGVTSSANFYADLSDVSIKDIKSTLDEISAQVYFYNIPYEEEGIEIRDFVESFTPFAYQLGCGFYQLTKKVEVQGYKKIALRHQISGKVFSGDADDARDLLGLPKGGTIKLVPGNHGSYDIFIQSTATNRKLVSGTQLMYWPNAKK
jgi:hypothetical protein